MQLDTENLELLKEFLLLMQFALAFLAPVFKDPVLIFLSFIALLIFWLLRGMIKKKLSVHYKSQKTEVTIKEEIIETVESEPELPPPIEVKEEPKSNEPENNHTVGVLSNSP